MKVMHMIARSDVSVHEGSFGIISKSSSRCRCCFGENRDHLYMSDCFIPEWTAKTLVDLSSEG